jgi:hypothetical protein
VNYLQLPLQGNDWQWFIKEAKTEHETENRSSASWGVDTQMAKLDEEQAYEFKKIRMGYHPT